MLLQQHQHQPKRWAPAPRCPWAKQKWLRCPCSFRQRPFKIFGFWWGVLCKVWIFKASRCLVWSSSTNIKKMMKETIGTFRRWVMTFSESITWYIYVLGLLVKELENPEVEAEDEEKDIQSDGEVGARIFELFGVNLYMSKGHHKSAMWCQMLWSATFSSMQWQVQITGADSWQGSGRRAGRCRLRRGGGECLGGWYGGCRKGSTTQSGGQWALQGLMKYDEITWDLRVYATMVSTTWNPSEICKIHCRQGDYMMHGRLTPKPYM